MTGIDVSTSASTSWPAAPFSGHGEGGLAVVVGVWPFAVSHGSGLAEWGAVSESLPETVSGKELLPQIRIKMHADERRWSVPAVIVCPPVAGEVSACHAASAFIRVIDF